jgi:hypothetical protein
MSFRGGVLRATYITAATLVSLLTLTFALLEFQQYRIHRRSERLLADFQSIHLNTTTWQEAQIIIRRWGASGHAHGFCGPANCAYEITATGWPSSIPIHKTDSWLSRLEDQLAPLLRRIGLRLSILDLRFVIEDGAVRRTRLDLVVEAGGSNDVSALLVGVRSHAALDGTDRAIGSIGADEELGIHPSFVAAPDSFCTGCETISLVYTPQIAPDELRRLTSFQMSCLTRWKPCRHLQDFAPALTREYAQVSQEVPRNSVRCNTPPWALARDAQAIWLVDALGVGRVLDPDPPFGEKPSLVEQDQIRLVRILKGPTFVSPRRTLRFRPYSGTEYEARGVPEHLTEGHRYIVFPTYDGDSGAKGVGAWSCGVIDDSSANELSIQKGIAMNDHLRVPELTEDWPW